MSPRTTGLLLVLLLTAGVALATWLEPRSASWRGQRAQADTLLKVLLGDGRRMFASHFYTKADVYLHGGHYPSIFDQSQLQCDGHLEGEHDHAPQPLTQEAAPQEHDHEEESFLGEPNDWLDRFSRRFRVIEHKHLEGRGTEREILPWLKLSTELDPHQVETYIVAAYWLRTKLNKVAEAEAFLREGLRANPESEEILFELGRLIYENKQDAIRARNLWEAALRRWQQHEAPRPEPDLTVLQRILAQLAHLEEEEGNYTQALVYLRRWKNVSPHPEALQKQIEHLQSKVQSSDSPQR